jgi:predicted RNA binding protein YcfA (HicA-like mRNA interferase family)
MKKLPAVGGRQVVKALQKVGFEAIRQRGSHVCLRHQDGRSTVVPIHKGEDLGPGILRKIIRDVEMERNNFINLLKRK